MTEIFWHNLNPEEIAKLLGTDLKGGLTEKAAKTRQREFGKNLLPEEKPLSRLRIFLEQFQSPLIYILIIAGIVTSILREFADSIVIFGAVILNTIVGYFQENKACRALSELKKVVKIEAQVLRAGNPKIIDSSELVPGDIFKLNAGNKVPADGRIIESHDLKINEMALTGEWLAAEKNPEIVPPETPMADRDNMVYMGTMVEAGIGKAIVTETGLGSQIGKVAQMVKETKEEKTPLQKKLANLSKIIGGVIGTICIFIFIEGVVTGNSFLEMFTTSVAVAVAAIPEGLPVAMTVILALGMQRILKKKGLVRKLVAAETLGSTSVICVPGDTLIWANPSIKSISTINKNDKVIGIDKQFSLIKKRYKRVYSGEMIGIKPVGLPKVELTPEHPILIAKAIEHHPCIKEGAIIHRPRIVEITQPEWTPASDVKKGDLVLVPKIKRRDAYGRFAIRFKKGKGRKRIRVPLDQELSELLGWYLAEGCYSSNQVIFYFGKNEKENIERVKYLIENKLHLKTYLEEKQTAFRLVFTNVDLARFFKNNFGHKAPFKKIPNFILSATHQNITHFLKAYLKGDGSIDNYTLRFSTSSQQIAHQLILLLVKIGIRARIHHNRLREGIIRGRKIRMTDSYEIIVNGTQADIIYPTKKIIKYKKRNLVLKDENFVYFPIKSVKRENKSLEVFNIETESQTYCLPFVVHNCTDKTATLTEGKIKVTKVLTRKNKNLVPKIAILCNEAFVENPKAERAKWKLGGRPTDKALLFYGLEQGFRKEKLEKELPEIDEIPFDNQKKFLATLHKSKRGNILFISGAPETILEMSEMDDKERKKWKKELENLASQGFRTIALATKITEKTKIDEEVLQKLELAALLGLTDPLRKEVKGAIKICKEAGMKPILVTGDHKLTAKTIAAEIGLKTKEENIIEGKDLDKLSDEEFERKVKNIEVYARAEPRHKLRIIEAWQQKGEIVAMTGDGINDAPALKKANIGVALGSGTDVAKEASDLILLPDSFNIIVAAVEEGRAIIDNIRKIITYLLSDSFTEIILIATSLFLGFPLPIVAVQILWVNLIEDGPLSLCLAFEPKEKDLMKRKPQGQDVPLLTREMKVLIFIIGLVTDLLLLGLFFWLIKYSGYEIPHIRSIIFAGLTIDSIFYIFSCKSLRRNIWQINPFSNKFLILAWLFGVVALIAALYLPVLQTLLQTVPLNLFDWQLILGLGLFNIILIEATKWYFITKKEMV